MADCLLATDMDRTLLPNGLAAPEAGALERFRVWARSRGDAHLAYVTGRHRALARAVMADYGLPEPDWLVANVGTEIYPRAAAEPLPAWRERLATGFDADAVRAWAEQQLPDARLQEAEKQSPLKVSFYTGGSEDPAAQQGRLAQAAERSGLAARVVVSFDETKELGLVDFLAPGSGKARALTFLREHLGIRAPATLFAGDSGNDTDALLSGVAGILVGNATDGVRTQLRQALAEHPEARIFFAERPYTAGILEGMAHYGWAVPEEE
jgi:hypothetical protein